MTLIMGVLNVTPDSFSDGGLYLNEDAAIAHGRRLAQLGANIVDVGGESTRPGSERVDSADEQQRILSVVRALAQDGVTVSVDTLHADTARAAIAAGASIINDVSGGTHDPDMFDAVADAVTDRGEPVRYVLGHWRGIPDLAHSRATYRDVVAEVRDELAAQVERARVAGVPAEQLVLDPGLGFDKTAEQGWQLIANLSELAALGLPVMIGVSRKRMLAELLAELFAELEVGEPADLTPKTPDVSTLDHATAVVSALSAGPELWAVRVHDVWSTRVALQVRHKLQEARR